METISEKVLPESAIRILAAAVIADMRNEFASSGKEDDKGSEEHQKGKEQ